MLHADPADVAIAVDAIHSFSTLERARAEADPREEPTAVLLHDDGRAAALLLDALGSVALLKTSLAGLSCAWVPRARLIRALERVEPLEAIRLARMPSTDVRVWAVVHAASACRVAQHGKRDAAVRAAETAMIGAIYTRCGDPSCIDDAPHEWDEREILDENGKAQDDTTCTRCGMPSDIETMWSAWQCPA